MRRRWTVFVVAAALAGPAPAPAQEHAHPSWLDATPPTSLAARRVLLASGVELEVVETGPGDGEPVLFLHGYTDSWHSFSPVLARLPERVRAIVPSQRGHGDSDRPACCYGTRDLAADAFALLDALGIRRATVVGHSMGSFVAQRMAIERPDRIERLVLVGSGNTYATEAILELERMVSALEDPVPTAFIQEFQVSTVARPIPAAFLSTVVAESGKLPARVWRAALTDVLASDAAEELERIRVPTLLVWGEKDEIFPGRYREDLIRRIPGARPLVYAGAGHAPHWEQPDRFVADLDATLAGGDRGLEPGPRAARAHGTRDGTP